MGTPVPITAYTKILRTTSKRAIDSKCQCHFLHRCCQVRLADATQRLSQLENGLPLLQSMAFGWEALRNSTSLSLHFERYPQP
jgi:hypothetical protein